MRSTARPRRLFRNPWSISLVVFVGSLLAIPAVALVGLAHVQLAVAQAQTRSFTLYVRDGWIPMPDGSSVYVWGFTDDPNGPPRVPGPPIVVDEGDSVEITLINDRDPTASDRQPLGEGHTVHLHGLDTSMEHDGVPETYQPGLVRQGESYTYRFTANHAGTYFYHCHQNNVEHQQMGMYGPLIVRAAGDPHAAYTGGPRFDREYTMVLSEFGGEGHEAVRAAVSDGADPYNWLRFQPDYLLINDRAFLPSQPKASTVEAAAGERVLLRLINTGYATHTVSAGPSMQVVASDGRPWPTGPSTESLSIGAGEKYDVVVQAKDAGGVTVRDEVGQTYEGSMAGAPRSAAPAAPATGNTQRFTLYLRDGLLSMPDGAQVPVYGFTADPTGSARVPGPLLTVDEGDAVEITLVNDGGSVSATHRLALRGMEEGPAWTESASPGGSVTYRFRASRAGSYLYVGDPESSAAQEMGMYGGLVVNPAGGAKTVYDGGPAFDRQYTMVFSELDSNALTAPSSSNAPYAPNYFLINGLAYPDTMNDPSTMIHADPGQRVLIRAINGGQAAHALHLHGYHFTLAAMDGRPWPDGPMKDTVLIAPGESFDLLFNADQVGVFPFHDHIETSNTNNGVWLGGMHTMVAVGVEHPLPAVAAAPGDTTDSVVYIRDNYFVPNSFTVPAGTTVRWEHQGLVEHTVSSLRGLFDSGALSGGDSFSFTFTDAGRYDYFCRFHITNRGTINVQ